MGFIDLILNSRGFDVKQNPIGFIGFIEIGGLC
jgi:hypothetical protein